MALAELPVSQPMPVRGPAVVHARVEYLERSTVLWLAGELDLLTIHDETLAMAAASAEDTPVVVDLSQVTFLDAATVGLIASSAAFVTQRNRAFCVRTPSPFATRLLRLVGLGQLIAVPAGSTDVQLASGGP